LLPACAPQRAAAIAPTGKAAKAIHRLHSAFAFGGRNYSSEGAIAEKQGKDFDSHDRF
jgi:hypothetical protein